MCANAELDTDGAPSDARYREDELLPLSALQHLLFCERQCALIHVERIWVENRLTAEGRILHERVHEQGSELRGDVRTARGVALRSLELGVSGVADVVEFHRPESPQAAWRPKPVEYKRGKPKPDLSDCIQLCAQALCLEEMFGTAVAKGSIFYGMPRRRQEVVMDDALRAATRTAAMRLHALIAAGRTPPGVYAKKCEACSLLAECMPEIMGGKSAARYLMEGTAANPEAAP